MAADHGTNFPAGFVFSFDDSFYYFYAGYNKSLRDIYLLSKSDVGNLTTTWQIEESNKKVGTWEGAADWLYDPYDDVQMQYFYFTLNNYTLNDGSRLPILTGGTYDENGYFTKSS